MAAAAFVPNPPCSTPAARAFLAKLHPPLPLEFPSDADLEGSSKTHPELFSLGRLGMGAYDLLSAVPMDRARRFDLALVDCTWCGELVHRCDTMFNLGIRVMVSRAGWAGRFVATSHFVAERVRMSFGAQYQAADIPYRPSPARGLLQHDVYASGMCKRCADFMHLTLVRKELDKMSMEWETLDTAFLQAAGGAVNPTKCAKTFSSSSEESASARSPVREEALVHPLFEQPDLVGLIAEFANPFAEPFARPPPASVSAAGSKRKREEGEVEEEERKAE